MNGTMSSTRSITTDEKKTDAKAEAKAEALWRSKTDKATRYEQCINCNEMILDNWFLRHVTKCVATKPDRDKLLEEATKRHHDFKIDLLNKTTPTKEIVIEKPKETIAEVLPLVVEKIDKKLLEPTKTDQQTLNAFQRYTFKFGDLIEAVVTDIDKYNVVHVNMINGNPEKKGMIKNTKVRTGVVTDMHAHFRIGDKIRAEVSEVRVDGKLWLSTKRFPVPTYSLETTPEPPAVNTVLAEKLEIVKEKIVMQTQTVAVQQDDKQLEEVLTFIKSKIGIVSPEAKAKIKTLLEQKGMFTFMMALAKVADIQLDVGLVFAAEIENKMGNQP